MFVSIENGAVGLVAGVDEVGRGPLAGPVVAAAVILERPIKGVTDSKLLSPFKREQLAELIKHEAACYAYGRASIEEIDALNIHHASLLAMKRAILNLSLVPELVLVDGLYVPDVNFSCQAIIKGDLLVDEIGAASILAKVLRDQEMKEMDLLYPNYGFSTHKGYPTPRHRAALVEFGPCPIHRRSYAPVAALLEG